MNKYNLLTKMHISQKYLKIAGIIVSGIIVLFLAVVIFAYIKREALLRTAIEKVISKAKNDYNLNVKIDNAHFEGLTTVAFNEISVVPFERDSLADLKDLRVGIRLMPLLFGNIKLSELKVNYGKISLIKRDSIRNYDFLFKKDNNADTTQKTKVNVAELVNNLMNKMLNKVPENMDIKNFLLLFKDNDDKLDFYVTSATIDDGELKSTILVNDKQSTWHLNGEVEPDDKQFDVNLFADGKKVELPFLEKKYSLKLSFDTIHSQLKNVEKDGDELKLSGNFAIKNLLINQPKIAANDIIVPNGSIDADMTFGENFVSIDSSSVIHLKNVEANPFIKYTLYPDKIYELKLKTPEMDAQELVNSFPQGLFESLEGMKVTGKLKYSLNLYLDTKQVDSVQFDSRLDKKDFKITGWGKTNLQKLNSPFVYTPYEYGKPVRNITIGPDNSEYVTLDQISPNLKYAVLTAEDPSFFRHKGFVELSFKRSIATNYKEKAFKRGGSTISMQLVKNVFLNRQKTIARKIEEIFIVWLIENTKIAPKDRMFEVYLNLIEWGRNVYGITEASNYYFSKSPSELSVGESIFLASIVPRPKSALYFFQPDGSLRPGLHGYFNLIGNLMAGRGYTSRDTSAYGFYDVRLKESLRQQIAPVDSAVTDSLLLLEADDEDSQSFLDRIFNGKKEKPADSIKVAPAKPAVVDTVKTPADRRKEKREQRRREREEKRNK